MSTCRAAASACKAMPLGFQHHGAGRGQPESPRRRFPGGRTVELGIRCGTDRGPDRLARVLRGRLQRSTLTGTWLGGPVTVKLDERLDHGQGGSHDAGAREHSSQQLAAPCGNRPARSARRQRRLDRGPHFLPATGAQPARWRVRADSTLVGVASELPEPLEKAADGALPLHLELSGTESVAQLRVSLADRLGAFSRSSVPIPAGR